MNDLHLSDPERDDLYGEFVFAPNRLSAVHLYKSGLDNADFIAAVFPVLPEGAFAGVCRGLGPIQPVRIGGCPLWRTTDLRKALGITEFCDAPHLPDGLLVKRSGAKR